MKPDRPLSLRVSLLPALLLLASGLVAQTGFYRDGQLVEMNEQEGYRLLAQTLSFDPDTFRVVPLKITTDLRTLERKKDRAEYQPAQLEVQLPDGLSWKTTLQINTRGKARLSICQSPPLKLKWDEAHPLYRILGQIDDLKLVGKCKNGKAYEGYVYKEYLAYRLFNALTDYSYRVQLLEVTFVDTGRKGRVTVAPAFLIEESTTLADRQGLQYAKGRTAPVSAGDPFHTASVFLFQYMIGNTDWSFPAAHNLKFFSREPTVYPIPYDFDYAGLVNAIYAIAREEYGLRSVTERYYMGSCSLNDQLPAVVAHFREKKDRIMEIIQGFHLLSEKDRRITIGYMEDFYKAIESPKLIKFNLENHCKR